MGCVPYSLQVGDEYEALDEEMTYTVHLNTHRCTCNERQISGISCRHSASAVKHRKDNVEEYCDGHFLKEAYLQAYGGMIHPIPNQRLWEVADVDIVEPPPLRRLSGSPRKSIRRDVDEPEARTSQSRRSQTL